MSRFLWLLLTVPMLLLSACDDGDAECAEGTQLCDGECRQIDDPNNCGTCGNICGTGLQCVAGECTCRADETLCDGRCVKIESDADHCGGCGQACGSGNICIAGECCAAGSDGCVCEGEMCGDACVDTMTDEANCGGCDIACESGESCIAGACSTGDLFAACFNGDSIVPFDKETNEKLSSQVAGIDGAQSIALLGANHLVAVGGLDDTFYVIDRSTMKIVESLAFDNASVFNLVLVREQQAYVVDSGVNTVIVIDLTDPTKPEVVDEISTGANTRPWMAAFDDAGVLWVSLTGAQEGIVLPIEDGEAQTAIELPASDMEGEPAASGVAFLDGKIYVTLANLSEFVAAGNGRLLVIDAQSRDATVVDLGETCRNPGGNLAAADGKLIIPCGNDYASGTIVRFDVEKLEVEKTWETGGGPGRVSLDPSRPGFFWVADGASGTVFAVDDEDELHTIDACVPPADAGWEMVGDVLAAP